MNYEPVHNALASGADPAMLCATCPWDRHCITPPEMTRADIEAKITEAQQRDEQQIAEARATGQEHSGLPVGSLMTALVFGGRDSSATLCPVFSLRLRSGSGKGIAEGLKQQMQNWDDEA